MWPFDLALTRKLEYVTKERDAFRERLDDAELRLRQQGEIITEFRRWAKDQPDPPIRPCLCLDRWYRWRDGAAAGPDGILNSDDDDLVPGDG